MRHIRDTVLTLCAHTRTQAFAHKHDTYHIGRTVMRGGVDACCAVVVAVVVVDAVTPVPSRSMSDRASAVDSDDVISDMSVLVDVPLDDTAPALAFDVDDVPVSSLPLRALSALRADVDRGVAGGLLDAVPPKNSPPSMCLRVYSRCVS
jgi:hypothetical protein